MYDKNAFLESMEAETRLCKHLHTKIDAVALDYALGKNMRNTRELLGYLSAAGVGPTEALVANDWAGVGKHIERSKGVTLESFPAAMDEQMAEVRKLVEPLTDADFDREASFPWGGSARLGVALVDVPLKFLASYRLQLFCHIKASGQSGLDTFNAWLGMDRPAGM